MARVLVADDNALSLEFFKEALTSAGHVCVVADDGDSVVQRADSAHFDLMLIDARMPVQDGPQALHAIRSGNGPCRDAPALATTADASVDRAFLLDAGFAEVIVKPISIARLHASISRHVAIPEITPQGTATLDDALALETTGGDASIVAALRSLFAIELDALPAEIESYAGVQDFPALRDRLHRLDASAGFCGAPVLGEATRNLRAQLVLDGTWPDAAIDALLAAVRQTRGALD